MRDRSLVEFLEHATLLLCLLLGTLAPPSPAAAQSAFQLWEIEKVTVHLLRIRVDVCDRDNAQTNDRVGIFINRYAAKHPSRSLYYPSAHYLVDSKFGLARNTSRSFYLIPNGIRTIADLQYLSLFKQGSDGLCLRRVRVYVNDSPNPILDRSWSKGMWLDAPGEADTWMITFADERVTSCQGGTNQPTTCDMDYPFPAYAHYAEPFTASLRNNGAFKNVRNVINRADIQHRSFDMCELPGDWIARQQTCTSKGCTLAGVHRWLIPRTRLEQVLERQVGSGTVSTQGLAFGGREGRAYTEVAPFWNISYPASPNSPAYSAAIATASFDLEQALPFVTLPVDVLAAVTISCMSRGASQVIVAQPQILRVLTEILGFEVDVTSHIDDPLQLGGGDAKGLELIVPGGLSCPQISMSTSGDLNLDLSLQYPGADRFPGPLCLNL